MALEFITNNIEFLVFILFMIAFLWYKKKKVEVTGSFPFLYMVLYKTRYGLDKMKKWSTRYPKFFTYLSYFSIFIGIVGIFASTIFMIYQLNFIVDKGLTAGGGLVLPIKTEDGLNSSVPVLYVPFWYWIIALFILVVVHEFAHGVIAEKWKIKVKSSGFAFLGIGLPIMPAAFVEPDEKSLKKAKWWKQIAVMGAGSMSNFIFGFLFVLMTIFIAAPIAENTMTIDNITFGGITDQSSLQEYNITNGEILTLNGITDKEEVFNGLLNLSINQTYTIGIKNQNGEINDYEVLAYENPSKEDKGMIGVFNLDKTLTAKEGYSWLGNTPIYFFKLLNWLWLLNIGIGIMNLLPIWITDGGQITLVLLKRKLKKKTAGIIFNIISFIVLALIIFTLKPSLLFSVLGM